MVQLPPAGRVAASTVGLLVPFAVRLHTATALPDPSTATWGGSTDPCAEMSTGSLQEPPAGRAAACTVFVYWVRLRIHTATAARFPATAMLGFVAGSLVLEIVTGESHDVAATAGA